MRVGIGYDIHRVVADRPLYLGGVTIPSSFGLDGHSDADVIIHALMDAILGAAGLGDIGTHFPPHDEQYRGIASVELLRAVMGKVGRQGFRVINVDIVLVAEAPRIAPYVSRMCHLLAPILHVPLTAVGIKATTNEGMGAEGRGEAMSAQAVALLDSLP